MFIFQFGTDNYLYYDQNFKTDNGTNDDMYRFMTNRS